MPVHQQAVDIRAKRRMKLGTKSELARHWKLDARNRIFKKLKPASYLQNGSKVTPLYAIDPDLTAIKVLDFNRVNRQPEIKRPALVRFLAKEHGEGWFERIEALMKK